MLKDTTEIIRQELFTDNSELEQRYPQKVVAQVMRLRDMYQWMLSNPSAPDKQFVSVDTDRHQIQKSAAYSDLRTLKDILPGLSKNSTEWHRWRFNEMILETYRMAKIRKDTRTMEKAAASYAKYNKIDAEGEQTLPFDMIVVQPFTATSDPSVLGITPIPNLKDKIQSLLKKYRAETLDIEYIDYEPADTEEDTLFPAPKESTADKGDANDRILQK